MLYPTEEMEAIEPTRNDLPNVIVATLTPAPTPWALMAARRASRLSLIIGLQEGSSLSGPSPPPTTLSSHSPPFTGLDPHGHAVPRNGFPLADAFETLAERLGSHGYDTLGVVGASVLNAEMGIQQGFRLSDDETPLDMGRRYEDRADSVTRRAIALLEQREKDRPVFLWVHYYDAHSPYNAPRDFQKRYVDVNHRIPSSEGASSDRLADRLRADKCRKKTGSPDRLYHAEVA